MGGALVQDDRREQPSTRHYYRQLLDGQVLPAFKATSLAGIDRMAVREWIAGLIDSGPGASRIRGAHAVLSMILDSAVDANRLAVNVAANMRGLPRRPEHEMHFLTEVQVEDLAEAIDPRYATLVRLAAYTGRARARPSASRCSASTWCVARPGSRRR